MDRLGIVRKVIPALCKVSQAFWNIVLVLLRALEWAATGFLLVRLGTEKQRGPETCLKAQHRQGSHGAQDRGQEERRDGKGDSPNVSTFS